MKPEEREIWESLQYRMKEEGFHYCFKHYSDWSEIEDSEFHRLRLNYLETAQKLQELVNSKLDEEDDLEEQDIHNISQYTPVVVTCGYNDVLKKPFELLYEFGYCTKNGCVVYIKGERSMQNSYAFNRDQVRIASEDDLEKYAWGN